MELSDYLKILRTHWVAVLLCTLLGGAAAFGWTLVQPKVYTSEASGIITTGVSEDLGAALVGDNYAKSRVKSFVDVATSQGVAEHVIEQLSLDDSPAALIGRVAVSNPLDTAVLKVTASASTPESAQQLAEAWIAGMSAQIAEIENSGPPASEPVDEAGTPTTDAAPESVVGFQTFDAATLPTGPSSPNTRLSVALGLLVGLALGVGYAVIRTTLDRRIRNVAALKDAFDVPVIGSVPFEKSLTTERRILAEGEGDGGGEGRALAEAMRKLRTNLQFMNVDHPARVVVVTSSLPGEGKTTVTANLALAIAASGQPVVVVDGDLRRPMVATTFGAIGSAGLTDVLIGRATLNQVVQPWGSTGRLAVLAAGSIPPNPSELLGSEAMRATLAQLAQHAIVLIDAPPLLPVTDAAVLAARTDGAIVVSYAGRTRIDALEHALAELERVQARPLGLVLNGVPRRGVDRDAYASEYGGYYDLPSELSFDDDAESMRPRRSSSSRNASMSAPTPASSTP
jgi:capsular exopolysaccharide synthesis family protein